MSFTTRPTLRGSFGMVSSTHWLVSQSAMGVLERGGNAFDAAVCGAFVLHIAEPHMNGPGGEVPAIVVTAEDKTPRVLCGQGTAPAGATIAHYRDLGLDLVPGAGPLAATIPGAVDAWLLLLRDHGTWKLRDVLDAAIGYARAGHPLLPGAVETIEKVRDLFVEHWPGSAELWLPGGELPTPYEMFANPAYADTLERLVREAESVGSDREAQLDKARSVWKEGFVAEAIDVFSRKPFHDSSGSAHAGLITGHDMSTWSATWEPALTLPWEGYTVAKTNIWGQGPVLLQALGTLSALGDPAELDFTSERSVHFVAEVVKLAMADREAWYGDGSDVDVAELLSPSYAEQRGPLVGALASGDLRPGSPGGAEPQLFGGIATKRDVQASRATAGATGEPTVARNGVTRGDTSHIDVVDKWGNMIAAMPSGGWLHGQPTIPELGFCLGSRGQMFWLEHGLPSSLAPGRRPRTTLSPTLVMRDGEPVLACGSPGGDQQDQWQLLFVLRYLAGGLTLQEAIDAPAFHTSSFPSSFWPREMEPRGLVVEDRLGDDVIVGLERRGHLVSRAGDWTLGRLCAVARDPESGILSAGSNPRGMHGYAAGR